MSGHINQEHELFFTAKLVIEASLLVSQAELFMLRREDPFQPEDVLST